MKISRDFACFHLYETPVEHLASGLRKICIFSVLQCQFYLSTLDGAVSLDFRFAWVPLQSTCMLPQSFRSVSYQLAPLVLLTKRAQTESLVEKPPTEHNLTQKGKSGA